MRGIINIFKPPGLTSHDVVSQVRRKLNFKKVGHTGTLDPMATGVLPICIGQGTKIVEFLMEDQKHYRFEITFGYETDTLDSWGVTKRTVEDNVFSVETLKRVLMHFQGNHLQIPPQYSALKVNGKRAYDLARQDEHVDLKPRPVTFHSIDLIYYTDKTAIIDVVCSKGTYIRSLVRDIAYAMNTLGTMSFLLRKKTGLFSLEEAIPLSQFMESNSPHDYIRPIEKALPFGSIVIENEELLAKQIQNGVSLDLKMYDQSGNSEHKWVFLNDLLFGLAGYDAGCLKIIKRF